MVKGAEGAVSRPPVTWNSRRPYPNALEVVLAGSADMDKGVVRIVGHAHPHKAPCTLSRSARACLLCVLVLGDVLGAEVHVLAGVMAGEGVYSARAYRSSLGYPPRPSVLTRPGFPPRPALPGAPTPGATPPP